MAQTATTTFRFSQELIKRLGEVAEAEDRSRRAVIERALREYFQKHEEGKT